MKNLFIGIAIGLVGALGISYIFDKPSTSVSTNILKKQPTKTLENKKIVTFPGKKAKKLAKLPKAVRKATNLHLVASTRIPNDDHTHVVSAVYNENDGVIKMLVHKEPRKWLSFNRKAELGAGYGQMKNPVTQKWSKGWKIDGKYQFMKIKDVGVEIDVGIREDNANYYGIRVRIPL